MTRTRYQGVLEVVAYNWPLYAVAIATTIVSSTFARRSHSSAIRTVAGFAATSAAWWSLASLAASHWVHDRSELYTMEWSKEIPRPPRRWALLHAGHDEHSSTLADRFGPGDIFDFYDPVVLTEDSMARARRHTGAGQRRSPEGLDLEVGVYDVIFVLLALHEIRDDAIRTAFLAQLREALAPDGRVVLVDHLLDLANLIAFGPGSRHFLEGSRYRASIAAAGLKTDHEREITPFVRLFVLRR